jgi:hypothetical protein
VLSLKLVLIWSCVSNNSRPSLNHPPIPSVSFPISSPLEARTQETDERNGRIEACKAKCRIARRKRNTTQFNAPSLPSDSTTLHQGLYDSGELWSNSLGGSRVEELVAHSLGGREALFDVHV